MRGRRPHKRRERGTDAEKGRIFRPAGRHPGGRGGRPAADRTAGGLGDIPAAGDGGIRAGEAGATAAFSILIAAYGVGCVVGGFLQDRHGPRCGALWGTALLCGGLAGAALLPAKAGWAMGLAFSIPAGLGTAFLYPSIQSCVQKWYQGHKGFATGITGAAAGLSGAFLTLLVRLTVPRWGIRGAFWTLAGAALPVCLAGAALLTDPPGAAKQGQKAQGPDYTPGRMLRTRQYWLCTAAVCLSTPAVLLFSPIILRLGQARGLSEGEAVWVGGAGQRGQHGGPAADAPAQRPDRAPPHRPGAVRGVGSPVGRLRLCSGMGGGGGLCGADLLLFGPGGGAARLFHRPVRAAPTPG